MSEGCLEGRMYIGSGMVRSGKVRSKKVRSEKVSQERSGHVKTDQESTGQIRKGNQEILPVLVQMVHIYCFSSL